MFPLASKSEEPLVFWVNRNCQIGVFEIEFDHVVPLPQGTTEVEDALHFEMLNQYEAVETSQIYNWTPPPPPPHPSLGPRRLGWKTLNCCGFFLQPLSELAHPPNSGALETPFDLLERNCLVIYLKILCGVPLWFGGPIGFLLTAPKLHSNSGGDHRLFDWV